jgi:hypothetical protein
MALRAVVAAALLLAAFVGYVVVINRPLPRNENDVRVLERTLVFLENESAWSKEDDRNCDPAGTRLSLYCGLQKASIEITGEFHHRSAALQAVRRAIDAARPDNRYAHRLQDFNNAPDVTLETVHAVVNNAIAELNNGADSGGCGRSCGEGRKR